MNRWPQAPNALSQVFRVQFHEISCFRLIVSRGGRFQTEAYGFFVVSPHFGSAGRAMRNAHVRHFNCPSSILQIGRL